MYKKNNFIFNESVNEGVFPDLLKVTKIRPVYKRGNKQKKVTIDLFRFYQYFKKIQEKIVCNRLVSFTYKFEILMENQYGFKKNNSTISACQLIVRKIQEALDRKLLPVGMMLLTMLFC
jgi:hypothetical protein